MGRFKDIATEKRFNKLQTLKEVEKTMKKFQYFNDDGELITTQVLAITPQILFELGLDHVEDTSAPLKTAEIEKIMFRVTGLSEKEIQEMRIGDKFRLLETIAEESEENNYVN